MFEERFYRFNESFDSNLTDYTKFEPAYDYVLRFVVTGWHKTDPSGPQFKDAAVAVSQILGIVGDLSVYEIKSVCFQHVPTSSKVGYYSPSWYTLPWGSGYTDELIADEGTWTIDLVFKPKGSERSWTSVEKWKQVLRGMLTGPAGTPDVHVAGLITLTPEVEFPDDIMFAYIEAYSFWSSRQAFWEMQADAEERTDGTHLTRSTKINGPPGLAWNMVTVAHQLGHDGFGVCLGSAFSPFTCQPITVLPMGENIVVNPETGLPTTEHVVTWQTLPLSYKVAGVAVGAAIGASIVWAWDRLTA